MFFKTFPIQIYTPLQAFEPIVEELLPIWLSYLSLFRCRKKLTSNFFFTYGNKTSLFVSKSSLIRRMTHQIDAVVWADVWELALLWWRVIRLLRFVFLISWMTTGRQMVVYHSELTVLRCSSGTIATCPVFPKKQAIICLEVLRAWTTFLGFGSSWNTHTVDCCLLLGSYA